MRSNSGVRAVADAAPGGVGAVSGRSVTDGSIGRSAGAVVTGGAEATGGGADDATGGASDGAAEAGPGGVDGAGVVSPHASVSSSTEQGRQRGETFMGATGERTPGSRRVASARL